MCGNDSVFVIFESQIIKRHVDGFISDIFRIGHYRSKRRIKVYIFFDIIKSHKRNVSSDSKSEFFHGFITADGHSVVGKNNTVYSSHALKKIDDIKHAFFGEVAVNDKTVLNGTSVFYKCFFVSLHSFNRIEVFLRSGYHRDFRAFLLCNHDFHAFFYTRFVVIADIRKIVGITRYCYNGNIAQVLRVSRHGTRNNTDHTRAGDNNIDILFFKIGKKSLILIFILFEKKFLSRLKIASRNYKKITV